MDPRDPLAYAAELVCSCDGSYDPVDAAKEWARLSQAIEQEDFSFAYWTAVIREVTRLTEGTGPQ